MATCGDFGGKRSDGAPCGLRAGWGTERKDGPCRQHGSAPASTSVVRDDAHHKKAAFLQAFRDSGNVTVAAMVAGIARRTHYVWLDNDSEYAEEFADAKEEAGDRLEEEARRRAVEGVREPVGWFQGSPGGYVQKYSDTLLIFLLKGAKPERYRDRVEHSGDPERPVRVESDLAGLSVEELLQRRAKLLSEGADE